MTDSGAGSHDRPLCACHGVPMKVWKDARRSSGVTRRCAVKALEHNARSRATPAGRERWARASYARMRRRLEARIALKRARLDELEALHEAQD